MNRAWIPAGALAGVSVAGLIALGPLTDSLTTQVPFAKSIPAAPSATPGKAAPASVPVSIIVKGAAGDTQTAALTTKRGGRSTTVSTSSDAGQVAFQKFHSTSNSTSTATSHSTTTNVATPPATPKKKTVKRQASIGTIGEQNGDSGLAGGSKGTSNLGGSTSTPGP